MEGTTSTAMQRVRDALLEGNPVPPEAHAALTDEERAEVAGLAVTATLVYTALQTPDPPAEAEASSLKQVTEIVAAQPPAASADNRRPNIVGAVTRWLRSRKK